MKRECAEIAEMLPAWADDGLVGEEARKIARHVDTCEACREEAVEIRALLAETRRAVARPARDEKFWRDLARDVRLSYERSEQPRRRGLLGWLLPPAIAVVAVGALIAVVVVKHRGGDRVERSATAQEGTGPATPGDAPAAVPTVLIDEHDLDDRQLDAVLAALEASEEDALRDAIVGDEIDDETAEALHLGDADPYRAVEDLEDDQLERVLDALAKGV